MRSKSLKVGVGRTISHCSTVRVALWAVRNHLHCTVKNKSKNIAPQKIKIKLNQDKIKKNKPRSGHDVLIKLYST